MNRPDWPGFSLDAGILAEPSSEGSRLIFWVPIERDRTFQYWQRIGSVTHAEITVEDGLCATAATSIRARSRSDAA